MQIPHPGNHPTGLAGLGASILLLVLHQAGVKLTYDQAVVIVGAVVSVVSLFTPRLVAVFQPLPENVVPLGHKQVGIGSASTPSTASSVKAAPAPKIPGQSA
jgi:hypothetical protein